MLMGIRLWMLLKNSGIYMKWRNAYESYGHDAAEIPAQ